MKQEGYQIPTKLPLSKADEKMLKRIQRKIKNKVKRSDEDEPVLRTLFSRFLLKTVDVRRKSMSIHSNDKLLNILMKTAHLKSVCQQWRRTKGKHWRDCNRCTRWNLIEINFVFSERNIKRNEVIGYESFFLSFDQINTNYLIRRSAKLTSISDDN